MLLMSFHVLLHKNLDISRIPSSSQETEEKRISIFLKEVRLISAAEFLVLRLCMQSRRMSR